MEAKQEEKKQFEQAAAKEMGGELVKVEIELFSPFIDFLKDYMKFFGSKDTLESLCRKMIYEQSEYLYNELTDFAQDKAHFLGDSDWYWRYPHMSAVSAKDEEEEQSEEKNC